MIPLLKYTRDTKISQPQFKKVSAAGLRFFPHHFGLVSAPGESARVRELTEQKHNLLLTPPKKPLNGLLLDDLQTKISYCYAGLQRGDPGLTFNHRHISNINPRNNSCKPT